MQRFEYFGDLLDEAAVKRVFLEQWKKKGFVDYNNEVYGAYRIENVVENGMPDVLLITERYPVWVEFKHVKGDLVKLRPSQERWRRAQNKQIRIKYFAWSVKHRCGFLIDRSEIEEGKYYIGGESIEPKIVDKL
jgi:hypothetical protein